MREGSSGSMEASSRFIISRSSLVVNAASNGPLLPIMETCCTAERLSTSNTGSGTSYFSSVEGGVRSIRATSSETLPWPIMLTCSNFSSGGGDLCWTAGC